ncbi:MAG TPA: hypothetical protein VFC63_01735 [Blastocatellia bacterium]|nr:hypothetical protein [Blastocatellia bacterium]
MWPYVIVLLVFIAICWGIAAENKRIRSRTAEEYERDVADPKLKATRAALSPFEYLINKQAEAAHEMRMNERYGHSQVLKKKDMGPDDTGEQTDDDEE